MTCDGQTLPISEYETLFNLIGTTYGGDGQNTFLLPNLSGRLPIHSGSSHGGSNHTLSETGGSQTVTLTTSQLPVHAHNLAGVQASGDTANTVYALSFAEPTVRAYQNDPANTVSTNMASNTLQGTGGSLAHDNQHPYLAITFIISLFGIYPSQT